VPVPLQTGSESPADFYVTDALAAVLPNVALGRLEDQAHEAMTTAPEQYARAICRFLTKTGPKANHLLARAACWGTST
jgi:pimeloyl-ACP methyl ester carboxylesterase